MGVCSEGLSVLGDGAEWIWNLAGAHFVGAAQLLDVYHGCEHLAAAGRAALGQGRAFREWYESSRAQLVGDGYWGAAEALGVLSQAEETPGGAAAVAAELNYFCGHRGRLNYAGRLRRGQAIGSGLVEGTIKQRVNLRMKRGNARWRFGAVGAFVEFMVAADGPEWEEHWKLYAN